MIQCHAPLLKYSNYFTVIVQSMFILLHIIVNVLHYNTVTLCPRILFVISCVYVLVCHCISATFSTILNFWWRHLPFKPPPPGVIKRHLLETPSPLSDDVICERSLVNKIYLVYDYEVTLHSMAAKKLPRGPDWTWKKNFELKKYCGRQKNSNYVPQMLHIDKYGACII